ncbi:MAG: glycosyltransferase [Roseiarcus sp.]|uniref:glycosyltransferase n=1 Tax=Roseiarcus sp. TaxID=1969460 RepID=UPI003C1E2EB8
MAPAESLPMVASLVAAVALVIWIYLVAGRGGFWRAGERDGGGPSSPVWPDVIAVIPARDEADGVGHTVESLLRQDYPGSLSLILVDDESADGTADVARLAAAAIGRMDRLTIIPGAALPAGWTGKLWAMKQGVERADAAAPEFLLLTDADIVYPPDTLRRLVSQSLSEGLALSSMMAKLRCESFAERALIPAFIFFFQMLYPFSWVNDRRRATAAAAGGCMLVLREALQAAGGIEVIRGSLIDDCAMARILKKQGPIRLSLSERVISIRPYSTMDEIRRMVVRSAYAQLRYSPLLLAVALAGLTFVFVVPVLAALFGHGAAQIFGLLTWVVMAAAFQPTLRFYALSPLWGPILPAIALVYMAFTLESAYQSVRGRGGLWKGRVQARAARTP